MKGLKRKWVKDYIIILLIIGGIIEIIYATSIKINYYNMIIESMKGHLINSTDFYNLYLEDNIKMNKDLANKIVKDFSYRKYFLLEVIDLNGNVIATSQPAIINKTVYTEDYLQALGGKVSHWIGKKNKTGEKIMAMSAVLLYEGKPIGVIRYVTSLEEVDKEIRKKSYFGLVILMIFLALSFILSMMFTNSIVIPIKEMTEKAKEMAKSDFSQSITVKSDD